VDIVENSYPDTRILLISGHTDDESVRKSVELESRDFLQNPFSLDTLGAKISEMLT
jgi:YesN/AraC family two-component response regulator